MKILLINPDWGWGRTGTKRYRRAWPPLDLLTAAAMLRSHGHEPALIDARATGASRAEIRSRAENADLVVFQTTPLDRWQCPDLDFGAIRFMTSGLPLNRLIIAGAHGTLKPELVLSASGAKAVVRGEPEMALTSLADHAGDPRGLAGFSYRTGNSFRHEPDQPPIDLANLPMADYGLIAPDHYHYELLGPRLALLETSRGCPFSCKFCLKAMYGPGIRFKSLELVLAEVEYVIRDWGAGSIYFFDLEFTLNRERTMEFCKELASRRLNISWCCQTRVDTVDPELLRVMKSAGCSLIHFGVETASPLLMAASGKGASLAQVDKALSWCREAGLHSAAFFLFGLPGETAEDRRAAIKLAKSLNPDFASFHITAPYPGAGLQEHDPDNPFPPCLAEHDLNCLAREARRALLSFYLRPGYVFHCLKSPVGLNLKRLKLFLDFVK